MDISKFRVGPNDSPKLSKIPIGPPDDLDKDQTKERTAELVARMNELQEMLWADHQHKVLVVLQATDTAGKDSTIRRVFGPLNPQGVRVASFKRPTEMELSHDYLWRVHQQTPASGEITIFNRSHYEDVLVVRVHNYVEPDRWKKRYEHINNFEQMLTDEGTTIIKFYLHIDRDEQAKRLQERLDDPTKNWKFESGDLAERELWDEYREAFEAMLDSTSTPHAPWFVVPAKNKWFRDHIVAEAMVDVLETLNLRYPQPETGLENIVIN